MAKDLIDIGTTANDNTGDPIRDAFNKANLMFTELYDDDAGDVSSIEATAPIARDSATGIVTISLTDGGISTGKIADDAVTEDKLANAINSAIADNTAKETNATHTGDVTGSGELTIGTGKVITTNILDNNVTIDKMANDSVGADELVDNSVGAAALNVSGNGSDGNILKSDGDGSFSWIANDVGDITGVAAGAGLTGGGTAGDVTLTVGAGTGITVGADAISLTAGGITSTQLGANSATPAKVSLFDDNAAATDTHILVADGTDFINKAVSGDATLANTGALTIANDAVTTDKILNANITVGKMAANSVDSDQYVDGSIDTIHIADNNITHDKLENRYTEAVTVSTLTGTYSLDWSAGAVFVMSGSLSGGITFQFGNMKIGQVIDIYNLTGAQTVTFSTASGTPVFNKAGAVDYAGASTNLIQVQCVSDAANAVFNYAVSAYVSDATPS